MVLSVHFFRRICAAFWLAALPTLALWVWTADAVERRDGLGSGDIIYHTSFDSLADWTIQRDSGAGTIGLENWPAHRPRTYSDPVTGDVVELGGRVAAVRHNGRGQVIAINENIPAERVVITAYLYEETPTGAGDCRIFGYRRDAHGGWLGYSAGSRTEAPPGSHWNFGQPYGLVPNDYRNHYVVVPQGIWPQYHTGDGEILKPNSVVMPTPVRRNGGWHQIKLFVTPHGSYAKIDGINMGVTLPNQEGIPPINTFLTALQGIGIGTFHGSGQSTVAYVDELKVERLASSRTAEDLARAQIAAFLRAYGRISDSDQIALVQEARRLPDSDPRSLWNTPHKGMAVMMAYGITAGAHAVRYRLEGDPDDRERALRIIHMIIRDYPNWRFSVTQENLAVNVVASTLIPAWFLWDELPDEDRAALRAIAIEQSSAVDQALPGQGGFYGVNSEFIGNSAGEENGWPAGAYPYLISLFRRDLQAESWLEKLRYYAYHVITNSSSPSFGGFRSQTVWDRASVAEANALVPEHAALPHHDDQNLFDNHLFHPHPGYGFGAALMPARYQLLVERNDINPPSLVTDLQRNVAQRMLEFIDLETFRYRGDRIYRLRRACMVDGTCGYREPFDPDEQHVFRATGMTDWGQTAIPTLANLHVLDRVFGMGGYRDPVAGRYYALIDHMVSLMHYLDAMALRAPTPPGTKFRQYEDLNRGIVGSPAYNWERLNLPYSSLGYFLIVDTNHRIPAPTEVECSRITLTSPNGVSGEMDLKVHTWQGRPLYTCGQYGSEPAARIVGTTPSIAEATTPLIPVEPQRTYTVEYRVRVRDLRPSPGTEVYGAVIASEYNENARESDFLTEHRVTTGQERALNLAGTSNWLTRTFTFDTHSDTRFLRLRGILGGWGTATGEVWFADVWIKKNAPPSVSAGSDKRITLPSSAMLNGSVSDDGLPDPPGAVTTVWSKVSGPGAVRFGNPSSVMTTASFSSPGTYRLRLTADDGELTAFDDLEIVVLPEPANGPPSVPSVDGPSRADVGDSVSFTARSRDPEGQRIRYTFDWGDGEISQTGFVASGSEASLAHAYGTAGAYELRVQAVDENGQASPWSSPLSISVAAAPPANEVVTADRADIYTYFGRTSRYTQHTQSFKAAGEQLCRVGVALAKYGHPTEEITLHLRSHIRGTDLATAIIPARAVTSSSYAAPSWVEVSLPECAMLTPGARYYLVLTTPVMNIYNYYRLPLNRNNPYRDGVFFRGTIAEEQTAFDMLMMFTFGGAAINNPPGKATFDDGPSSGTVGSPYFYRARASDPDGHRLRFTFDWGDGQTSSTEFVDAVTAVTAGHTWEVEGVYHLRVRAEDEYGAQGPWSDYLETIMEEETARENTPPGAPRSPAGPGTGAVGQELTYFVAAEDPDGDRVRFIVDWGDGTKEETGYVSSGTEFSLVHAWQQEGAYVMRSRAVDERGASSPWSGITEVRIRSSAEEELVISEAPTGTWYLGSSSGRRQQAQSFKAIGSRITAASVALTKIGSPGQPIRVSIRRSLTASPLASAEIQPSQVTSTDADNPAWVAASFNAPAEVKEGYGYFLVLEVNNPDADNHYRVGYDKTDPYRYGMWYINTNAREDLDMACSVGFGG